MLQFIRNELQCFHKTTFSSNFIDACKIQKYRKIGRILLDYKSNSYESTYTWRFFL